MTDPGWLRSSHGIWRPSSIACVVPPWIFADCDFIDFYTGDEILLDDAPSIKSELHTEIIDCSCDLRTEDCELCTDISHCGDVEFVEFCELSTQIDCELRTEISHCGDIDIGECCELSTMMDCELRTDISHCGDIEIVEYAEMCDLQTEIIDCSCADNDIIAGYCTFFTEDYCVIFTADCYAFLTDDMIDWRIVPVFTDFDTD